MEGPESQLAGGGSLRGTHKLLRGPLRAHERRAASTSDARSVRAPLAASVEAKHTLSTAQAGRCSWGEPKVSYSKVRTLAAIGMADGPRAWKHVIWTSLGHVSRPKCVCRPYGHGTAIAHRLRHLLLVGAQRAILD